MIIKLIKKFIKKIKHKKAKQIIKKKLHVHKSWLDGAKEILNALPYVQRSYEQTLWQYDVITTMPSEVQDKIDNNYLNKLNTSYYFISTNLASIPSSKPTNTTSSDISSTVSKAITATALSVADTTSTIDVMFLDTWAISSPDAQEWKNKKLNEYRDLQKHQKMNDYIQERLKNINKDIALEFEEAVKEYYSVKITADLISVAIKIRNVLEHVKGELFNMAINRPKEQKIKWDLMSERLAKGGSKGIECKKLKDEESIHKRLHDELSRIAKNLKIISAEDLNNIFILFIDHLFTILGLTENSKI